MNTRKIDEQIQDYYEAQKPSPQAVARVRQLIRAGAPVRGKRRAWMAAAAAAALIAVFLLWTAAHRVVPSPQQVAVLVAREAALGHNKKQELEFRVRNGAELQAKMRSLDFTPVEPAMMQKMNMRIVGARYTTIAGGMAAQIVYLDPKGVPCTLYETRPVDRLALVASGEHQVDGVHVTIWREKGLLLALARPIVLS